jgi:hypothetical protein
MTVDEEAHERLEFKSASTFLLDSLFSLLASTTTDQGVENWSRDSVFEWAKTIVEEEYARPLLDEKVNGTRVLFLLLIM